MVVAGGAREMTTLCRDCSVLYARPPPNGRCEECASPRLVSHEMLAELAIAHVDCDAFYATVEKRERPELADRPVIVGGGKRGVVLACCYVARLYGVRSAMPMFKALAACPDAEVIRPNMAKYREVGRAVRAEMRELTPLVEPVSIDEAFLDLSGTEALHRAAPAQLLATLARRVEAALGITLSIGLSDNKFLAKIASDLDKPRGFAILGRRRAGVFRRQAGIVVMGRGEGAAAPARRRRDCLDRPARRLRRARAGGSLWPDRRAPRPPRPRYRRPRRARHISPARFPRKPPYPRTRPPRRRSRKSCGRFANVSRRS